ncbi:MAG: FtsX-like permease family protein [Ktedonobacteraceae bacterium]
MPGDTHARYRPGKRSLRPAVLRLAFWQLRRTWFLLLFITLGMIAAVAIACAIPLLSDVMLTAGMRQTLQATPDSADIELNTQTQKISTSIVKDIQDQFGALFHHYAGNIIRSEQFAIPSGNFSLSPDQNHTVLTVYGTSIQQAVAHLGPIQGRLAHVTSNPTKELEVMLTPDTARALKVKVGSTFNLASSYLVNVTIGGTPVLQQHTSIISARVVGLFTVRPANAAYWHGQDFSPIRLAVEGAAPLSHYTLLVPDNALLAFFDQLSAFYHTDAIQTVDYGGGYNLIWHYHLDSSHLTINGLDALIDQLAGIQSTNDSLYGYLEDGGPIDVTPSFPYLLRVELASPIFSSNDNPSILEQFRSRIAVARIPVGVFTILILALILFFVSLMTTVLIDRQTDTVVLLRSRGASSGQVFGALLLQSVVLGIIALVIGLPLAVYAVFLLAQRMLLPAQLDALNIITSNPLQAALGTSWYALAIVFVALFTMSLSLFFAARMNILSMRREASRSNKRPLWQRLNLDVIAGVIALVGYGLSLYVTSVGAVLQGDAQVLIASPLAIIAPFFLIVGCMFLFLRIFPWLLQLGARLAARGRGAVSLLALAQIARSPRQSLRRTLLLALAIAFALFTLVYSATQAQHIQEIVTYQTGADFSAQLSYAGTAPAPLLKQYGSISGVISTSVGYIDHNEEGTANLPLELRAVDAASFGSTVIWPSQAAFLQARPLLAQLVSLRQSSAMSTVVPAIVDQTTSNKLLLHIGSPFTVRGNSAPGIIHYFVVGVVDHIPTINDRIAPGNGKVPMTIGGILVDYQSYANVYKNAKELKGLAPPDINQVWLHTRDDAISLASVRAALKNSQYHYTQLVDRRLLLATLQSDPLYLILDGVLIIGTVTALLLALIGDLLGSWLNARTHLLSFVTLRALGTTSRQVTNMLTWEQAIVYITGLLLGGGFGILLATSVIPVLTFTDLNSNLSNEQLFALQSALATQLVVPPSFPLVLLVLVSIYVIALTIMVRIVSRPALSSTLRLDED